MPKLIAAAVTLWASRGPDLGANAEYARALALRNPDAVLLFGTTGEGALLRDSQRRSLLSCWLEQLPPGKLIICGAGHSLSEPAAVRALGSTFLSPPWPTISIAGLADYIIGAGPLAIYSHPSRTPLPLTRAHLQDLGARGALPAAVKLSKVSAAEVAAVRAAAPTLAVWHGTDRDITASLNAGAEAVVSQVAGALMLDQPRITSPKLQAEISRARNALSSATGVAKLQALRHSVCSALEATQ